MLKRTFLQAAAVLALAASLALPARMARAADAVTVQLDWVVRGNHAMFFVGREKGFFAKHGIEVTEIRKGTGSPDALRLTGNGNAAFGFGDLPTLPVARSQGVPVVAVAAACCSTVTACAACPALRSSLPCICIACAASAGESR